MRTMTNLTSQIRLPKLEGANRTGPYMQIYPVYPNVALEYNPRRWSVDLDLLSL
jgi:hypothetical protein